MGIAFGDILCGRPVRKFETLTDLHLLQFARGNLEHSERGMVSDNKHNHNLQVEHENSLC